MGLKGMVLHMVATDYTHDTWILLAAQFSRMAWSKKIGCGKAHFNSAHFQKCNMKAGKVERQQHSNSAGFVHNSTSSFQLLCNSLW